MRTNELLWVLLLICSLLPFGFSKIRPPKTSQGTLAIPGRFQYVEAFVRTLERGGIVVQSVDQSTAEALFRDVLFRLSKNHFRLEQNHFRHGNNYR